MHMSTALRLPERENIFLLCWTGEQEHREANNFLFAFSTYFEKLLTKAILALNDHKTIEPLKMMVEQEQASKSQFLDVVRRWVPLTYLVLCRVLPRLEDFSNVYSDANEMRKRLFSAWYLSVN